MAARAVRANTRKAGSLRAASAQRLGRFAVAQVGQGLGRSRTAPRRSDACKPFSSTSAPCVPPMASSCTAACGRRVRLEQFSSPSSAMPLHLLRRRFLDRHRPDHLHVAVQVLLVRGWTASSIHWSVWAVATPILMPLLEGVESLVDGVGHAAS